MKIALSTAVMLLLLSACQKDISLNKASINGETVSSDALTPLPCHSISFKIDKPDVPGEVPSFRFTKTLYADSRVKTINMLSRVYPIYPGFKKHAVELIGTFTYGPNIAFLKGTSQVWEYYKTAAGAGARRSISKKTINYKFYFTPEGLCRTVSDLDGRNPFGHPYEANLISATYDYDYNDGVQNLWSIEVRKPDGAGLEWTTYMPNVRDKYGNVTDFQFQYNQNSKVSYPKYDLDYSIPRDSKNYSFIPSQNLISQEYSLMEVMQWVPLPTHQRKGVSGVFYNLNGTKVEQKQMYKNYKFDAKGNQISVTYGDNVPQRTTWNCK